MSAEENKTLVQRFFNEVCNARKLAVADELFSVHHSYTDPSSPGIPAGPEGQKQLLGIYQTSFPDCHWQVEEMLAEGDKVVTRWTARGTHQVELPGNPPLPATGKAAIVPGVWIHQISGGKIVKSWNVWDTLGMLQQLGVIPTPA